MTYAFNEKQHIHTLDDKPLVGVTSVLQIISKPALIQWAANMAVGFVTDNAPKFKDVLLSIKTKPRIEITGTDMIQDDMLVVDSKFLDEARYAHKKKKEKAGDWGTILHKEIEEWIKNDKSPVLKDEFQQKAFQEFKKWVGDNKVEFLESEKHVWSKELWIGGITDMVIKMDGKKYVADIKTSSGIYNEMFFQMAAYDLCLKEMGGHEDIEGYLVINLKKDGTMDLKRADNMEINRQAFLSALTLYKIINSLK